MLFSVVGCLFSYLPYRTLLYLTLLSLLYCQDTKPWHNYNATSNKKCRYLTSVKYLRVLRVLLFNQTCLSLPDFSHTHNKYTHNSFPS